MIDDEFVDLTQFDIVFISYDEPNCEENYADLLSKFPKAKRVHGIKGHCAAHRAAGKLSNTEYLITVDGDNIVNKEFFLNPDHHRLKKNMMDDNTIITWPAKNDILGIMSHTGGLKFWPKTLLENFISDELAEKGSASSLDYSYGKTHKLVFMDKKHCRQGGYIYLPPGSVTINGPTPYTAWKTAYREGIKCATYRGHKLDNIDMLPGIWQQGSKYIFTMGADHQNGLWHILGYRMGFVDLMFNNIDPYIMQDYSILNDKFNKELANLTAMQVMYKIVELGKILKINYFSDLPIKPFTPSLSKFIKGFFCDPLMTSSEEWTNVMNKIYSI